MHNVKRFAETLGAGYQETSEFHVPQAADAAIRLGPGRMARRASDEGPIRTAALPSTMVPRNARLWHQLHVARPAVTQRAPSVLVPAAPLKSHLLGLQLAQTNHTSTLARPLGWFQIELAKVRCASERCDKALDSAKQGLAKYTADPKKLRDVLVNFREAKSAFHTAKDVAVFREMKDLLQEAWQSARCRCSHQESFALQRAETDSAIRDLSQRIDSLHEHILRQAESLAAADADIEQLKAALSEARAAGVQVPLASPRTSALRRSGEAAPAWLHDPHYAELKAALREEILEAFKTELMLSTGSDAPRFAGRAKNMTAEEKDALQKRFAQMRKLASPCLPRLTEQPDAQSEMSWLEV